MSETRLGTVVILLFLLSLLFIVVRIHESGKLAGIEKRNDTTITTNALPLLFQGYYLNGLSFQQDAIVSFAGWQYAVFYDANRMVNVARRQLPMGNWQIVTLTDYTQTSNDAHNIISMGIAPSDGTIHLAFDHHKDTLNYRRSLRGLAANPGSHIWSEAVFGPVTNHLGLNLPISELTYPRFAAMPNGNLQFTGRIGGSGNAANCLWEYSGSDGTWRSIGRYIDNPNGGNAYLNGFHYDRSGRLHVSWVKRETHDHETNHDLHYAYSDDYGRTWRDTKNNVIGITDSDPMIIEEPVVWAIPENSGLINQEAQAIDSQGQIHVLLRQTIDGINYQFHYWRDLDGDWHETNTGIPLVEWFWRSKIAIDNNDNLYALMPNLVIAASTSASNWKDWKVVDSSESGRFLGEPVYDWYRLFSGDGILSIMYQQDQSGILNVLDYRLIQN